MDNLDDSENNAKISDSAYSSNSCSNSQSRRSHSSKSTHSGSNSSGSSGYGGGNPSKSAFSPNTTLEQISEKRSKEKDLKMKKKAAMSDSMVTDDQNETDTVLKETTQPFDSLKEESNNVAQASSPAVGQGGNNAENMEVTTTDQSTGKDEIIPSLSPVINTESMNFVSARMTSYSDGFSCVISMHDGVIMYTTSSLTTTLGFPKEMWIGRSFLDFVHPRDRDTFASQITSGLAVPKNVNGTIKKENTPENAVTTMVCRIRRYRGLSGGFGVKDLVVTFMPFLLKLSFKTISDEEGNAIYLVIQATPFFSAFKTPNETILKAAPFVIRHSANGNLEYIDPESVSYLGYLPQDVTDKDALHLYHPADLSYLRQVYETIVKEGGMQRDKSYRMMAQNGDYVTVETEWSSFINPWTRKLEFVIGKHYIIEGPANPDVFQSPDPEKSLKLSEEEKCKAKSARENILRIMSEVLTKPAVAAKQQMTKRCQDLAVFMESLVEEPLKIDDDLRLEIQDPDHSYYERDSVMLGGISPHHDYNDCKSSTETPLSYNQLNYNENLQRYFESHQPYCEEVSTFGVGNVVALHNPEMSNSMSPMAQNSGDSGEISSSESTVLAVRDSSSPSGPIGDYQPIRLTESLLNKHNTDMEKELVKKHRENRSSSKWNREKSSYENRQKKKEHIARCNAAFQPASLTVSSPTDVQPHGVKRPSKQIESETAHKHHCLSPRQTRRRQNNPTTVQAPVTTSVTTTVSSWPTNQVSSMNTFILGVGIPQQMSILNPMTAMQGMFPMYYAPAASTSIPSSSQNTNNEAQKNLAQFQQPMQCMMYGQAVYGSPFMYSPIGLPYPMQQNVVQPTLPYNCSLNPLGLASSNYEEACKTTLPLKSNKHSAATLWREKKRMESKFKMDQSSGDNACSSNREINDSANVQTFCPQSAEAVSEISRLNKAKQPRLNNSDETGNRTDGESSYSSFYSSFFKTESGSAEESGDGKKTDKHKPTQMDTSVSYYESLQPKKIARRKMDPPWMEQVCVTSNLIYKYQIMTRNMEDVLKADKQKIQTLEQPSLVNEQLGQLYLDMQLEGVAARLTLDEGITSSSSSGEETFSTNQPRSKMQGSRRKREYSKLVMIYEEDAPLPPPMETEENKPSTSKS